MQIKIEERLTPVYCGPCSAFPCIVPCYHAFEFEVARVIKKHEDDMSSLLQSLLNPQHVLLLNHVLRPASALRADHKSLQQAMIPLNQTEGQARYCRQHPILALVICNAVLCLFFIMMVHVRTPSDMLSFLVILL